MSETSKPVGATYKTPWSVYHKVSTDGQSMEIIVGDSDKLEITVLSIPIIKATPVTIEEIERKISEAFQKIQRKSNCAPEDQLELRVDINEDTGAQEVYFSNKNGLHQLVVSSADFEV